MCSMHNGNPYVKSEYKQRVTLELHFHVYNYEKALFNNTSISDNVEERRDGSAKSHRNYV